MYILKRYDLSFDKNINGKRLYGSVGYIGDKLEIERFYYQPANAVDALFPSKVTKDKAKETALAFLKKFPGSSEYQLDTNHYDYYPGNQILTEPIRYSFSFVRVKDKVPISDQRLQIIVLGNGEVSDFYRSSSESRSLSYDDIANILPKNEIMSRIKENLSIDLQYIVDFDYRTGNRRVNLTYQPSSEIFGVHALSGEWQTGNGFAPELPKHKEIEYIVAQPIEPRKTNISLEEAKALAEQLLKIDSDEIKLKIESIEEKKNYNGQEVISIQYMYEYRNSGHGTNLEIDKHTGEIIQYHDIKSDVLRQYGDNKKSGQKISSNDALNQAVKYLKQFSPSYLHYYAMPTRESLFEEERGIYHFSFPRVVNNILVNGDQISVTVSADGSLLGLNIHRTDIKNWPSIEKSISKEKAEALFFEQLNLNLNYIKDGTNKGKDHYHLVYTPVFNDNPFSYIDANTGKWISAIDKALNRQVVSHPWAEKELNHLINAGILNIEDTNKFNANAQVTKGAAIEVIMKSLTRFHIEYYHGQKEKVQSFKNINSDHQLYQVIERAVTQGILKKEKESFDLNSHLTREELAVWYIRTLGLEDAAKNHGIYQLNFADAKDVNNENIGFVALAHSLGLLTTSNNKFNPKQEVTYADLAVSTVRLAHEVYKKGIHINY